MQTKKPKGIMIIDGSIYDAATGELHSKLPESKLPELVESRPSQEQPSIQLDSQTHRSHSAPIKIDVHPEKKPEQLLEPQPNHTPRKIKIQVASPDQLSAKASERLNEIEKDQAARQAHSSVGIENAVTARSSAAKRREQLASEAAKSQHVAKFAKAEQSTADQLELAKTSAEPEQAVRPTRHHPAIISQNIGRFAIPGSISASPMDKAEFYQKLHQDQAKPSFFAKLSRQISSLSAAPAAAGLVAAFVLVGYFSYLSIPNMAIRVAANRSGVDAIMPRDDDSRYGLNGPIKYSKGLVELSFKDKSTDQTYAVKQQKTAWDEISLEQYYIQPQGNDYKTFQVGDHNVYISAGSASWIENGVLFFIESPQEQLSTRQLLAIAKSY